MAWSLIKEISRVHQSWVLTAAQNRAAIEAALQKDALPNVRFEYVSLPRVLQPLLQFQGTLQFYAYLWQWKAFFAARKLHRYVRFDLFHHLTYENDWMASIIGALLPIPYFRGPCGGAHRIPRRFLREFSFSERVAELRRVVGQWLFRHDPFFILSHARAKAIVLCNQEAVDALPKRWRNKALLMSVNGVAKEFLARPTFRNKGKSEFSVLSAGRLIRLKGFDLAIRAFGLFAAQCPYADLTIVGDGPELPRLENLVRDLGLEARIRFEKWMPREKLLENMRACDVFLFTSLRDGGGLVVVEAMASAKPVICLDLAGPGLHVTNKCGIKVFPQSPDQVVREIAEALQRLNADRELLLEMGMAARERAEQIYAWDRMGNRLLTIYQDALGVKPNEA